MWTIWALSSGTGPSRPWSIIWAISQRTWRINCCRTSWTRCVWCSWTVWGPNVFLFLMCGKACIFASLSLRADISRENVLVIVLLKLCRSFFVDKVFWVFFLWKGREFDYLSKNNTGLCLKWTWTFFFQFWKKGSMSITQLYIGSTHINDKKNNWSS